LFFSTGILDLIPAGASPGASLMRGFLETRRRGPPDAMGILDLNTVSAFFMLIRGVDMVILTVVGGCLLVGRFALRDLRNRVMGVSRE